MTVFIFWTILIGIAILLAFFFRIFLPKLHEAKNEDQERHLSKKNRGLTIRQWRQLGFVFVLGVIGIFAHTLRSKELFDSAALYVGLPFLLALGMCILPKAKSHVGATFKGITIAILLAFPVLQEGVICMLMASPLLYIVGLLLAWSNDRHKKKQKGSKLQLAAVTSVLALASIEGVHEKTSFPRNNTAEYSQVLEASIGDVRKKLASTPDFKETRPVYMRIFPLAVKTSGSGLNVGDERKLDYIYKKWIFTNEKSGSTVFRITESTGNYIRFDIPHDKSYLSSYLTWQSSEVFLIPINENRTKVTWRLSYTRKLDPVWYFGPMQHHYVTQAAKALVDNVANPIF